MLLRIHKKEERRFPDALLRRLRKGDQVTIIGERDTKPGEYLCGTHLLCIRRNKRDKWWQFWEPRIKSSTFRYMGE